jgi:hypothetical protein
VTVINPAAMPSGTELFFGYLNSGHALFFDLIYTNSYTCSNGLPPSGPPARKSAELATRHGVDEAFRPNGRW